MKKLSSTYLVLLVVLCSVTITTVLADTVTITTYPYQIPGSGNPGLNVDNAGNVGIGTTTPAVKMDIYGNDFGNTVRIHGTGASSNNFAFLEHDYNSGTNSYTRIGCWGGTSPCNTVVDIGNVGIGTTIPSQKLDVNGNIRITGNIVSPNDICIGSC